MLSTVTHVANRPKPATSKGLPQEVKALAVVLREEFDATFRFYDALTGGLVVVPGQEDASAMIAPEEREAALDLAAEERPKVCSLEGGRYLIAFPLTGLGPSHIIALGVMPALARTRAEAARERDRLERWGRAVHDRLVRARDISDCQRTQAVQDRQSMIAWEALMALERLHRGARIHKEPARERRRILRIAGELLGAQSLAWVPVQRDDGVVSEGERLLTPWDCDQLAAVLAGQARWEESGYVIINEPGETSWARTVPAGAQPAGDTGRRQEAVGMGPGVQQAARRRARAGRPRGEEVPVPGPGRDRPGRLPDPVVPPLGRGPAHAVRLADGPPGAGRREVPAHQGPAGRLDPL